jgi:hypothetical protein
MDRQNCNLLGGLVRELILALYPTFMDPTVEIQSNHETILPPRPKNKILINSSDNILVVDVIAAT